MPMYVQLLTWTERGSAAAKETVQRAQQAREQAQKLGARLRDIYWTMGRYDAVAILEAPNDETASGVALAVGAKGFVRTETLRAYTEEEIAQIVAGL